MRRLLAVLALLAFPALAAAAPAPDERVDLDMVTRIRAEGLQRSHVMDTLFQLTDVLGPRLTGSPAANHSKEWTPKEITRSGSKNAHITPLL